MMVFEAPGRSFSFWSIASSNFDLTSSSSATGAVARGDQRATSDVGFLVRFAAGRSLFDQVGLIHDLQELLGVEVDVMSEGGLRDSDVAIREDATAL